MKNLSFEKINGIFELLRASALLRFVEMKKWVYHVRDEIIFTKKWGGQVTIVL